MTNSIESTAAFVSFNEDSLRKMRNTSMIVGVLLFITGIVGAVAPQVLSLVVAVFLGWLLIVGGILTGYLVYLSKGRSMIAWLKPVLLVLLGSLFLFYPVAGVATMAILLTVYLLLDALGSLGLAHDIYPLRGWGWMTVNGIMSLLLAGILLFAWPVGSAILVGLYIGISLAFDGLALFLLGLFSKPDARA